MNYKELLQRDKAEQEDWEKRGEEKTLEYCLLNLIFEERYYLDDEAKDALLQEMAGMILDFRENRNVNTLEDNIKDWHSDLFE